MTYYKLIKGGELIGVGSTYDLRRFQKKHGILVTSDEAFAQYIQINDKLYRDDWFCPPTGDLAFEKATIIVIDKPEYDALFEAFQTGAVLLNLEQEAEVEEPEILPDPAVETTIAFLREMKIKEMNFACGSTITDGFYVELSDGKVHHFSLTIQDQLNLVTLSEMLAAEAEVIPYHADGELCKGYSPDDISTILSEATKHKIYHTTYFNSLKAYINSLENAEDIREIKYGIEIPENYQSDVLKAMIGD